MAARLWRSGSSCLALLLPPRRQCVVAIGNGRTLLSKAFACDTEWQSRRASPEFSQLSATDLGNRLQQSLDKGLPVAPVDFDIFVQKLDEADAGYVEFFEQLLLKFRRTQEATEKLESTDHALVRAMLRLGAADRLLPWLRDKFAYGVFLDEFSASLLVDHLLLAGDAKSAALASFEFALQDPDSVGDVCLGLMLLSCSRRLAEAFDSFAERPAAVGDNVDGREEIEEEEEEEEEDDDDDDEVSVEYVDWIRQPCYDDSFDIVEEKLQIGKTLWLCAERLLSAGRRSPSIVDCAVLGLAAYERPQRLVRLLAEAPVSPSQSATADAGRLLLAAPSSPADDERRRRFGRRPVCERQQLLDAAAALGVGVDGLGDGVGVGDWTAGAERLAAELVSGSEEQQRQRLARRYAEFNDERRRQLRRHNDWLQRRRQFRSVKAELDALVEEQEALTYFDNAGEVARAAWLAPRTGAERRITSKKLWAEDVANVPRYVDEFYDSRPPSDKPTTPHTRSDRVVLRRAAASERLRPLKE